MIIDAEMEDPEAEDGVIVTGVEDDEMTLTCRASGGPPVPRITWSVPATLRYEVIEEDFNVQVTSHFKNPFFKFFQYSQNADI